MLPCHLFVTVLAVTYDLPPIENVLLTGNDPYSGQPHVLDPGSSCLTATTFIVS